MTQLFLNTIELSDHQAFCITKGVEFDVVYICRLSVGLVIHIHIFPHDSYITEFPITFDEVNFGIYQDVPFKFDVDNLLFHVVLSASVMNLLVVSVAIFVGLIDVPFHVQVVMVPKVVILALHVHVDNAVFSTFESHTSVFVSVTAHVLVFTLITQVKLDDVKYP